MLTALGKYPSLFRAAIDVAGISDYLIPGGPWDARNSWVMARLGSPEANAEAYYDASPLHFVSAIRTPLLVMHGTADVNVSPAQSFILVDELIKHGKEFDFELYPGEVHYFSRRATWLDAYQKMEAFLDTHLRSANTR